MGCSKNISADTFPKQGSLLGKNVKVIFNYDSRRVFKGKCVRDDAEEPFKTIFQLEDNRVVLSTECQYTY